MVQRHDISFTVNRDRLIDQLRIKGRQDYEPDFHKLVDEAESIGKPATFVTRKSVRTDGLDQVEVDGVLFKSRVLKVNLETTDTVFPALSTSGLELEEWSRSLDNVILQFWAESIKKEALAAAVDTMYEILVEETGSEHVAIMTPGSLEDWPILQQKNLFQIFNGENEHLGVTLNSSCVLMPLNTISCLGFVSKEGFVSCQLCEKPNCPDRRARYDKMLFDRRYLTN